MHCSSRSNMRILEVQFATFCVVFSLIYADVDHDTRSPSEKLQFPPLPKGEPYALDEQADVWGLRGLTDIASGIALAVKNDPPYEIIGNTLRKSFEIGGKYPSLSEVIDYELPLIVLASFSFLAAIVIPVTGLILCCCRVKGRCGGSLDGQELILHPRKQRMAYSVGISLCALFLIFAGSFVLASSTRMNNSIQQARTVWHQSFDDINIYARNTLKELNHIAVQEAVPTLAVLLEHAVDLGIAVAVPVLEEGSAVVKPLYESVLELDKALSSSLELLVEIQRTTSSLVSVGGNLGDKLSAARQNISSAKSSCTSDGGGSACNAIPTEDGLTTEANFTKVPNVTDTYKKVEVVRKTNLTHEAIKGNKSFYSIPNKVQKLTTNFTENFKNFSSKIDNIQVDVLKPLEDDLTEYLQDVLYPVRDEVDNKYLGTNGALTKYDKYRHVIFILLGVLILLDGILLILAVVLGQVGASLYDTPAHRSNVADCGGRLMIGAAGLFFFSAFLVNLLVGILFLLGANVAVVCDDVPHYKLLQKTIDDPNVMGEYVLAKVLFGDGSIKLTTSGVLSECEKNQAPWNALMMDHSFNLSDVLHYKNKIPGINEAFPEMNETVQDTSVISDEAKASVNESLDAGVQEINYTQFHEQVNKPIVRVPLPPFVTTVKKAVNVTRNVSQSSSEKLKETADSLQQIQNTIVSPAQEKAEMLRRLVNELALQGKAIEDSWKKIQKSLAETEQFLKTKALSIATESLMMNWHTLFAELDFFLAYVINQVRVDVGRCRPLSNIYRGLTGSVCHHYAAGMNASWVAFGLGALFLLISIILCVRASKHFRRTRTAGQLSGEAAQGEAFELPWMDENTTQHDHQFLVNDFA